MQFREPQSKEAFLRFFNEASKNAKSCLEHEILVSTLVSACLDTEDPSIDPDHAKTRELLGKAFALAVEAGNKLTVETLAYVAENDLGDKSLAKEINAAKKKLKTK